MDPQQELDALVKGLRKEEPKPKPPAAPQPEPDPVILRRLYPEGLRKKMEDRQKEFKELEKKVGFRGVEGFDFYRPSGQEPQKVIPMTSWWT